MVLGTTTMAVALLASAATFAGSAMRYDLLTAKDTGHQRVYWAQLALFGLGVYLLVAIGAPAFRSLLPGASDLPAETLPPSASALSSLRLLFPVPFAVFAVLSGVAGAMVGRIVSRSALKHARAVPWLACLGLVGAFSASFLGTSTLIVQHGFPSAGIVVVPVLAPLIVITALVWREHSIFRSLSRSGGKTGESEPVDPDTVDEVLSWVIEAGQEGRHFPDDEVAQLARGIRLTAGSRARMSPAKVSSIVEHLVKQDDGRTQPDVKTHSVYRVTAAELCSACVSLAAGCIVVGSMGGLMPSLSSAIIAGIVGGAIVYSVLPKSRRAYSHPP